MKQVRAELPKEDAKAATGGIGGAGDVPVHVMVPHGGFEQTFRVVQLNDRGPDEEVGTPTIGEQPTALPRHAASSTEPRSRRRTAVSWEHRSPKL